MFQSIAELNTAIPSCRGCSLGGVNLYCLARGNPASKKMVIAEAPGKVEARQHKVLVGPAGILFDKIWASVGWDTNDWFLTNTLHCEPVAPKGSGKENLLPLEEQKKACRYLLDEEIRLVEPKVIVLLGKVAVGSILPALKNEPMRNLRGKSFDFGGILYYVLYHPSFILRSSFEPKKELELKMEIWQDVLNLERLMKERGI